MPIKFKPSERVYRKDARGRRMSTDSQKCKQYKHFYIKDVPLAELMEVINSDRKTPKLKQKCRNEVVRRGYKLVWKLEDGTELPKTHKALKEHLLAKGGAAWLN